MTKQKILIADDEAQIREILRIYFEKEGFEVIEAEDGAAAILKVQSEKYSAFGYNDACFGWYRGVQAGAQNDRPADYYGHCQG